MESSYSVIKSSNVIKEGKKNIITQFIPSKELDIRYEGKKVLCELEKKHSNNKIKKYKDLTKTMFDNYRKKGLDIISQAKEEAEVIKQEAYKKGYDKGQKKGYDDAYNEAYKNAYEQNMEKVKNERNHIINNAQHISDNMIKSAKEEYAKYIDEKKHEIKHVIQNIVECVFKKEIQDKIALNNMVLDIINDAKNSKSIVIKCKELNIKGIKDSIDNWKKTNIFKGDIFVLQDDTLNEGVSIIEKDNGKIEIDITKALEKVKEIIMCSD